MDHVLESGQFTPNEIKQINYCHLFLQAITVSDITDPSGTHLFPGIEKGTESPWMSKNNWHCTNQAKPSTASWKQWQKALSLFSTNGILHGPLLEWTLPIPTQRRSWRAYYHPDSAELFLLQSGKFDVLTKGRYAFAFTVIRTVDFPPPTSIPVDLKETLHGWRISSRIHSYIPIPVALPPPSFTAACHSLDPWEAELLQSVHLLHHGGRKSTTLL